MEELEWKMAFQEEHNRRNREHLEEQDQKKREFMAKLETQRIECEQRMRQSDMAFQARLFPEIFGSK